MLVGGLKQRESVLRSIGFSPGTAVPAGRLTGGENACTRGVRGSCAPGRNAAAPISCCRS